MQIINTIMTLAGVVFLLGLLSPVHAEENFRYFEMGESGQVVAFPMTAQEMAADAAQKNARRSMQSKPVRNPVEENLSTYEMGESGQTVAFPMTASEMARREAASERRSALTAATRDRQDRNVVVFEMGESGQIVTFPMRAIEIEVQKGAKRRLAGLFQKGPEVKEGWQ